ncbi:Echinoderm microtubule-associated protein-like 1 [Perkinsus chesapeaki]|uniref:Echinoderm microtubule-associated protein-like 1 n=1 Tax=Perkinsus chesapeaki TaxID=330153 RepID=A0A7J6N1S5_PERCH|nr:Echinoderm microtubule-associated protein-like 1 [Perkinsus chesapeaki]
MGPPAPLRRMSLLFDRPSTRQRETGGRRSVAVPKFPPKPAPAPTTADPPLIPELAQQGPDGSMRVVFGRSYGLVFPPTEWHPEPKLAQLPDWELVKEAVYGYNGDLRGSLRLIDDGRTAMYPLGAMVVMHSLEDASQRYFEGHSADVLCLDYSSEADMAASGQQDPKGIEGPFICLWSPSKPSVTLAQLHYHQRSVSALSFVHGGSMLVSVGTDEANMVAVWGRLPRRSAGRGADGQPSKPVRLTAPLFTMSSGRSPTYALSACDSSLLLSVGEGHYKFWKVDGETGEIACKRGTFGKTPASKQPQCCGFAGEISFLCACNGYLYLLQNGVATQAVSLGTKKVGCAAGLPDGTILAATYGGEIALLALEGGRLKVLWKHGIQELAGRTGEVKRLMAIDTSGGARFNSISVACGGQRTTAVLGTAGHSLLHFDVTQRAILSVVQVGHGGEMWGLAHHPTHALCATGGTNRDVRFWNTSERAPLVGKVVSCAEAVYSLAFNAQGDLLAIGQGEGLLTVLHFPSLTQVYAHRLSATRERICDIRFADNGQWLAAACWDQKVYLLRIDYGVTVRVDVNDKAVKGINVSLHATLRGNSSSPLNVMFTKDGSVVMSNSKDTQILYWRTRDGARMTSSSMFRDAKWQDNWSCVLGWPVIGVWADPEYDQTDVNAVHQSSGKNPTLLALGDDNGKVKLLRFPSPYLNARAAAYSGHASHVTNVRFSPMNTLVSIGGGDHCVIQWKVVPRTRGGQPTGVARCAWLDAETNVDPEDPLGVGKIAPAGSPEVTRGRAYNDAMRQHRNRSSVRNILSWD